ncbi:MAG: pilus assembly protein N-terminal domain-containing protein, partial [Gemmataceae bacterium]|nr:pilus assembly protein N-terminal domain-containing protein [Gemmataceae bacterium]
MRRERQEATASAQRSHRMRHSLGAALGCLLCVGILQVAAQQPSGGTPTAGPGLTVISGTLPSASGGGPGLPSAMGGVPAGSASTLPVLTPLMIGPDGSLTPVAIQPGASQPPAGTPPAGGGQPAGTMGPPTGALPQPRPFPQLFGEDKLRLPRLAGSGILGTTPVPTEKDLEQFRQFVEGVIDPRNTLDLVEGRSRIILLKTTPKRTQIVDETVANFRILEPDGRQMTIIGLKAGITVLNLWFPDPKQKDQDVILSYLVRVFPDPEAKERLEAVYKALEQEINRAYPRSRVRLTLIGDKIMVSGQAHDIVEAYQIIRIVGANAPGQQQQQQQGQQQRPNVPTSALTPMGNPFDPLRPGQTPGVEDFLAAGGPNVINNLRIPGEQQVMLRVMVAEVNRAAARSIGVNFNLINNQGTLVFGQHTGNLIAGLNQNQQPGVGNAAGLVNLPVNLDNGQIPIAIQALRTLNYAKSLAEPTLTARNGATAFFLAGGQFPVPVITGLGAFGQFGGGLQGVQFVPYGVQLFFTPIITDRDRIRLTVTATVSTRDNSAAATIAGAFIPGLNTRTFSTTVELREGQTMAVAGLIQTNSGATAERVPFFGDLPFIGRLASFQRASAGEQELVILVTPELVHPLEPHELPKLPGADVFEPGDLEFYLLGRLESRRAYDYRSPVMTDLHRMLSYRRCERRYILGPSGHSEEPEAALLLYQPPSAQGTDNTSGGSNSPTNRSPAGQGKSGSQGTGATPSASAGGATTASPTVLEATVGSSNRSSSPTETP